MDTTAAPAALAHPEKSQESGLRRQDDRIFRHSANHIRSKGSRCGNTDKYVSAFDHFTQGALLMIGVCDLRHLFLNWVQPSRPS